MAVEPTRLPTGYPLIAIRSTGTFIILNPAGEAAGTYLVEVYDLTTGDDRRFYRRSTNLTLKLHEQTVEVGSSTFVIPFGSGGAGTGDMLEAVYDPTAVQGDAFDMANMVEAGTNKILTATERTKLTGIEALADVTDATNVAAAGAFMKSVDDSDDITEGVTKLFLTSGERSKLSGIEALADVTDATNVGAAGAFMKSVDDSDDITEGVTKLFLTSGERSKLSGIEALADVTDATNVAAAGAFMIATHTSDNVTEGVTNLYMTSGERTKIGHITVTQAVDLDAIETRVNQLDAAVVLSGTWDASTGTFPGGGTAQAGASYIVSVSGTVDGVVFVANDRIVAIVDNADTTTYAANWHKLDYTDAVLSVAGRTGAITLAAADISDASANGRSLIQAADYAAMRALLDLEAGTDFLSPGAIAAAYQPLDSDLTSIAALATTSYGRAFLELANQAALFAVLGTGTPSVSTFLRGDGVWAAGGGSGINNVVEDLTPQLGGNLDLNSQDITGTGDINITGSATVSDEAYDETGWNANLTVPTKNAIRDALVAGYQPLATNLTEWAGINPSANGGALVAAADYAAMRVLLDLEVGTDFLSPAAIAAAYQPLAAALTSLASASANGISLATAANYAAMRVLLDLEVGTDFLSPAAIAAAYQPLDVDLTTWAGLTPSANAQSLVTAADYAAMRTLLGLVIGTNVQAFDADLSTWAGLTPSANAQSLVTAADYAAMRTLLGLVIGTNVQAYDVDLTTWAGLTPSANAQSLVTAADYAAMRVLLDLEAGTDFLSPGAIAAAYQPLDSDLTSIAALITTAYGRAFLELANQAAHFAILGTGTPSGSTFLRGDGVWAAGGGGGINNVVEDLTPQLGGHLDPNTFGVSAAWNPSANDGAALGTVALSWSDLFLATGAAVNFANGNVVLTHASGILNVSTGVLQQGGSNVLKASDIGVTVAAHGAGGGTNLGLVIAGISRVFMN